MALKLLKLTRQCMHFRQIHQSATSYGLFSFLNKPVARQEDIAVGYQKIQIESSNAGEDPLEIEREVREEVAGSGTRSDPFIIPSRQTRRFVLVDTPGCEGGPPTGFWVTLENGGRCPITAQYYKLAYDSKDKWGVDELDLFAH